MTTCKSCGHKNNPPKSKYCNNCGTYLKLAKKEIQYKPEKYKLRITLKKTLIEGTEIVNSSKSTTRNIFIYRDLIWSYLTETTNILKKIDDSIKEEFLRSMLKLFKKLKNFPHEEILNEFLYEINLLYEEYKNKQKNELKFLCYTNIKLGESAKKPFYKMLPLFDLKVFNYSDFKFEKNYPMQHKFQNKFVILEYSARGKEYLEMKHEALDRVKLFFGYLTFLHMYRKAPERWHINELRLNHEISDLEISAMISLNLDNTFIDYEESFDIIRTSKELEKSKMVKIRNNALKYDFYKHLIKTENKKILNNIKGYLMQYYLASKESELNISFIRFWTLSEKILKDIGGDMNYDTLVKYMKKVLKYYNYPKYVQNRIVHIKNKRNDFIHDNIDNFNQNDRNIIKTVTDNLIGFVIEHNKTVKNMGEYQIILDYFNQDTERIIELLTLLKNTK